jgi:hypothetical protein
LVHKTITWTNELMKKKDDGKGHALTMGYNIKS